MAGTRYVAQLNAAAQGIIAQAAACGPRTRQVTLGHQDGAIGRESPARELSVAHAMDPHTRRVARLACTVALVTSAGATWAHLGGAIDLGRDSGAALAAGVIAAAGLAALGRVGVVKRA